MLNFDDLDLKLLSELKKDGSISVPVLAKKMEISYYQLAKFITSSSYDNPESKILLAESLIEDQNWPDAKKQLRPLLDHKPSKKVCLLMSQIEESESNDPQKINAWISRSNFGELNKIWICRISNLSQEKWTSVSKSGYFNSLVWKKPKTLVELSSPNIESNIIEYINN